MSLTRSTVSVTARGLLMAPFAEAQILCCPCLQKTHVRIISGVHHATSLQLTDPAAHDRPASSIWLEAEIKCCGYCFHLLGVFLRQSTATFETLEPFQFDMTRTALLTVGSTAFTSLVHSFLSLDTLAALRTLHITHVVAQVGNSALPSDWTLSGSDSESVVELVDGLHVTVIKYAHDLEHRVAQASLVVSHAGEKEPVVEISSATSLTNSDVCAAPPTSPPQAPVPSCPLSDPSNPRQIPHAY